MTWFSSTEKMVCAIEVNPRKAGFGLLGYLPTSQGAYPFTMSYCHPKIS
jgi:hypothetical protein